MAAAYALFLDVHVNGPLVGFFSINSAQQTINETKNDLNSVITYVIESCIGYNSDCIKKRNNAEGVELLAAKA